MEPETALMQPLEPLAASSPLQAAIAAETAASSARPASSSRGRQKSATPSRGGRGGVGRGSGAPATFHTRIQSSGYGRAPILALHKGGPATLAARAARNVASSSQLSTSSGRSLRAKYEAGSGPPLAPAAEGASVSLLEGPQLQLSHSPDGLRLAAGGADGTVSLLRLPVRKVSGGPSPPALAGHEGAIRSLCWSNTGALLITASADGSACVWDGRPAKPSAKPLLRMSRRNRPPPPLASTPASAVDNPTFRGEVRQASFFYLDRFVLLANGNALYLYSYRVDREAPAHDAVRAVELRSSYRLRHSWEVPAAHYITRLANPASYLSPMVVVAASDRSLAVLDWATGAEVRRISNAHERAVTSISLYEGTPHSSIPAATRDLMLTAAADGLLKLWDLRAAGCVRSFSGGHTNRVFPIGASLSPCLRYVACGSEDRFGWVYDIGGGGVIGRLEGPGHSETVSAVSWHPLRPELSSAGLDGAVRFFSSR